MSRKKKSAETLLTLDNTSAYTSKTQDGQTSNENATQDNEIATQSQMVITAILKKLMF